MKSINHYLILVVLLSISFFSCKSTYNIGNKHIKQVVSPKLPNLEIEIDKHNLQLAFYVWPWENFTTDEVRKINKKDFSNLPLKAQKDLNYSLALENGATINVPTIAYAGSVAYSSSKNVNLASYKNFSYCFENSLEGMRINDIDSIQLLKKYDFSKNTTVDDYKNLIINEVKRNMIDTVNKNYSGKICIEIAKKEKTNFRIMGEVVALSIPLLFTPLMLGAPRWVESCEIEMNCIIKNQEGKKIKTYNSTGIGRVYSAAYWGYQAKFFKSQYIGNGAIPNNYPNTLDSLYTFFNTQTLPQRTNAIADALDKIIIQINNDREYIDRKLIGK